VSRAAESVIETHALGSCIALAIHDPVASVGGLLHFMLPESSLNPDKARSSPFVFADTGIPLLFHAAYNLGAEKRRLAVWVAGGAEVMDTSGVFNIGKRNRLALRRILWKAGVMIHGEETGGDLPRTVRLEVSTGRFWVRGPGIPDREMAVSANGRGER
jgi:chemotaxis protein CheD